MRSRDGLTLLQCGHGDIPFVCFLIFWGSRADVRWLANEVRNWNQYNQNRNVSGEGHLNGKNPP
jgi:hypothetical protein